MNCWLAQIDRTRACDGPIDQAHLIPKQLLKREGVADIWDHRLTVPACRLHHANWDNHCFRVPRESLPERFLTAVDELGLSWWVDRRFGS